MNAAALTIEQRRELIRAALYHQGDLQAGRPTGDALTRLGLAGKLNPGSRHYRLTAAGMELADQLARLDVRRAARRMQAEGRHYERPPRETLF